MAESGATRTARRSVAFCRSALSLLLASSLAVAQSNEAADARADVDSPIVPVHHEPHHRQVFQYGPTRILDLQVPPGDVSWFHTHEWPVLYMTLGQSAIRNQTPGSDWSGGNRPAGAAPRPARPERSAPRATSFTGYIDRPSTHRIQNVGDGLFRAMVVVNETHGNDATTVAQAGFAGEPELANAWFRSYRVTLAAGAATPVHEHHTPVVIFQATDGKGMADGPMDFEFNEPGQWAFYDAGVTHTIENLGGGPLELLEIEVRLE